MQNLLKKSYKILLNNLLFIQLLLIYNFIIACIGVVLLNKNFMIVPKIILFISVILLTIVFTAGWLFVNKYGILNYNSDDTKEETAAKSLENLKKFFEGVGLNFLRITGCYVILGILFLGVSFLTYEICLKLFNEPKIIYSIPKLISFTSQNEINEFLKSFSSKDILTFIYWFLTFFCVFSIFNYFSMLYFAFVTFEKDNIIKLIFKTIKFFFKNLFSGIQIIIIMTVIYTGLNLMSAIAGNNSIAFIITTILYMAYLNYYIILVFCLYYEKNNSNNGTELIG